MTNALDVCCVVGEIKRGPSGFPTKGAPDGPQRAYPTVPPPGRGYNRFVLPDRRRLPTPQPQRAPLRVPQETLGLGGHHPRALSTTARDRVRTLLLARGHPLLLPPFPRGGRSLSFLV